MDWQRLYHLRKAALVLGAIGILTSLRATAASYYYPTAELMTTDFTEQQWGSGTLQGRTRLPDDSVRFNLQLGTSQDSGKTVIGDEWPVSAAAELDWDGGYLPNSPDEDHAAPHDNVSIYGWDGIRLPLAYEAGAGPITVKLFMNTGLTGVSGYPSRDITNNTGWTGVSQVLDIGDETTLNLDFSNAQASNANDNKYPHSGAGENWRDGTWHTINERDLREVTNMGFEVYGPAGVQTTLRVLNIPEPRLLFIGALALLSLLRIPLHNRR